MKTLMRWISRLWPVGILGIFELILAATNYTPDTFLMGWDNVMPEFNFPQALTTNIFGAWQEHRGTGLADGMGHAANLVHTLFLWLLSLALPQNMLRYAFHFLMHAFGMVGMFGLLSSFRKRAPDGHRTDTVLPLIGALFYGLNLVTIQMFYTPLEAFSVHYTALPWLAYTLQQYLQKPSRTMLFLFISISILSSSQFFIPTLILPTAIMLGSLSIGHALFNRTPGIMRRVGILAATYLCVNAFWLLPYLYNLPYNAPIIQNAKINQMSSDEVYERNKAFGDPVNVLSLRGFMLDFEDTSADGQQVYVMSSWREWTNTPWIRVMGIALAVLMIIGARRTRAGFVIMWLVSFVFLANNTPGITTIMEALRDRLPLFAEAYRFPFTKFSLLFAFSGTIMLFYGMDYLTKRHFLWKIAAIVLLIVTALPAFQGNFFYSALRVNLPKEYFTLFTFMDAMDHKGRTAYLPQPSYWSWKHYSFGHVGSGFVWYGLNQPLMDRAFDPWSQYNEQYYWRLSHALYSKDPKKLNAVFDAYAIRYIIFDRNIRAPGHDRALFTEETQFLLAQLPGTIPIGTFGTLSVYERKETAVSFVETAPSLPALQEDVQLSDTTKNPVFSTDNSGLLIPDAVKSCGALRRGTAYGELIDGALRMRSTDQRACVSFGDSTLPHSQAYLVKVQTNHVAGRPMLFSVINNTAKHVETEAYLTGSDSFVLPPLASDGLGYTIYFTSDAIGANETVNDIRRVEFYEIPYQDMYPTVSSFPEATVDHPNPSYYRIQVPAQTKALILSQAFHPDWIAISNGKALTNHQIVYGWANGWRLTEGQNTVYVFFLPQALEYFGFLLLIGTVIAIKWHR